jgi:hypothetical protein
MDFSKLLAVITWLLEREQRVSHRFLRREFGLDQALLEDVCFELVHARTFSLAARRLGRACALRAIKVITSEACRACTRGR